MLQGTQEEISRYTRQICHTGSVQPDQMQELSCRHLDRLCSKSTNHSGGATGTRS